MNRTIEVGSTTIMVDVVAGLVQKGLTFRVHEKDGYWLIELTGGY